MNIELLSAQVGDEAFRKLMASPVSAPRKRIRAAKVEPITESIDATTCSLADVWRASRKGKAAPKVNRLTERVPTYAAWLRSFLQPADAAREDERAKAEWAMLKRAPGTANARRRRQIAKGMLRVENGLQPALATMYAAPITKPSSTKSRSSWPSFKADQVARLIAAGEFEYLAECGVSFAVPLLEAA